MQTPSMSPVSNFKLSQLIGMHPTNKQDIINAELQSELESIASEHNWYEER
jgi:hypothetical protein